MQTTTQQAGDLEWDLADRLRKSMRAAGLKPHQMAQALGLSTKTISFYINGHATPKRVVILAWAARTGKDPHWIETGELDLRDGGPNDGGGQVIRPTSWNGERAGRTVAPFPSLVSLPIAA